MPLYGHELTEQTDPFQAGLGFACYLEGVDFPGRDALRRVREEPPRAVRVGLELAGRRVARQGAAVLVGSDRVGEVTSGTFSPTFQKSIAMAYVRPDYSMPGTEVSVDVRGRLESARVTTLPFYRRSAKGTPP
jgi:aminomethyltransferase